METIKVLIKTFLVLLPFSSAALGDIFTKIIAVEPRLKWTKCLNDQKVILAWRKKFLIEKKNHME